ncbi:MAG: hypothetical protein NUV77_22350, partial [Thermoguttaceae bacterium]|nr:hypothetical protein [Thermoguttaceae bacterium]
YMVARTHVLFALAPVSSAVVAAIGTLTAIYAASIALVQTDIKRVLAYSTISQLGYMFLGLGAGTLLGVTAGMFHLVTHAFFKGLLFLAAGSVMHAMGGVIDLRRFGGLRRRLPITHVTFLVGCLALAGVPLLSGYFSKDEILASVYQLSLDGPDATLYLALFVVGLATAGLTAFYTFRAYFLAFHGEEQVPHEAGHHARESPPVMTWPLIVLAVFSAVAGGALWMTGDLEAFLEATPSLAGLAALEPAHPAEDGHGTVALMSSLVALVGIGLAWWVYARRRDALPRLVRAMSAVGVYQLSLGKFFFDHAYNVLLVWPLAAVARVCAWFDRIVIDGLVDAVGGLPGVVGRSLRPLQGGLVPLYALGMLLGTLVLLGALLL